MPIFHFRTSLILLAVLVLAVGCLQPPEPRMAVSVDPDPLILADGQESLSFQVDIRVWALGIVKVADLDVRVESGTAQVIHEEIVSVNKTIQASPLGSSLTHMVTLDLGSYAQNAARVRIQVSGDLGAATLADIQPDNGSSPPGNGTDPGDDPDNGHDPGDPDNGHEPDDPDNGDSDNGDDGTDPEPDPPQQSQTVEVLGAGQRWETTLYINDSGVPGPTVWVVGGVHGSEIAGWMAADEIQDWFPANGRLVVLPRANSEAVDLRRRYVISDLNRQFPRSTTDEPVGIVAATIWDKVLKYPPTALFDLHEGFDYWLNPDTNSVGQTIIYYPTGWGRTLAHHMAAELNKDIPEPIRKFTPIAPPVNGSLARAVGVVLDRPAYILETAMPDPLNVRIHHHKKMIHTALEWLDMW